MDSKLTLSLDSTVINQAKIYAKSQDMSLSKLIEMYLKYVTKEDVEKIKISPIVKELTGVITLESKDYKKDYSNYLSKKYQ
jgi:hypothetical protein|tara:strand:- start:467 stop:709 length:243 start_codon:yes stop_codon:yes gene_type:complete